MFMLLMAIQAYRKAKPKQVFTIDQVNAAVQNANAYGWELGYWGGVPGPERNATPGNPFVEGP